MTAITYQEIFKETYKYKDADGQIKNEAPTAYMVEKVTIDNGVFVHVAGMEYPERGVVGTEDILKVNVVKRFIIGALRLMLYFTPSLLVLIVLPWGLKVKILNKIITYTNDVSFRAMSPSMLKDNFLTPMAIEIRQMVSGVMIELGLDTDQSNLFAEIFANVINFDNAYRYRIQDMFLEISQDELLTKPNRTIKKMMLLNRERERQHKVQVSNKFKLFAKLIGLVLLHPKIRRAFKNAVREMTWENMLPNEADKFWMCVRTGYNYFGKSDEDRRAMINHLKVCKPTKLVV